MGRSIINHLWAGLRWCWRYGLVLTCFSILFIIAVPRSTVLLTDTQQAIAFDTSPLHFDFIRWDVAALRAKATQTLFGQQAFMSEATRSQFVRDYMADMAQVQQLEAQIEAAYTDPAVANPEQATLALRQERDSLRTDLERRQSAAEAILEGQVAAVLVDEGFGTMGQLFPPIAMRFTRMPNLLVTSPRDVIRLETSIALNPLSIDERATTEAQLDADYDIASLIVPLGGIALYPAMIDETASIPTAVETFAHEWLHHYLYFHPLGVSYFTGDAFAGEGRIINETTADLFGKEIARLVLQRYYPEQPLPVLPAFGDNQPPPPPEPDAFDFAAAMHETRATVDNFLAAGQVEAAEAYMEARRQFFFEHGYRFRKLNQAFFAFYGGYQAGGGVTGAGGQDPIGPVVLATRANSPSIHAFVVTMQDVISREQLLALETDDRN